MGFQTLSARYIERIRNDFETFRRKRRLVHATTVRHSQFLISSNLRGSTCMHARSIDPGETNRFAVCTISCGERDTGTR